VTVTSSTGNTASANYSITTSAATVTQYTVTWDANGGSVSPTSNTVNAGVSVTAPTPTRTGYTFANWRNPPSGGDPTIISAGASYTPTSSITFTAIWTAVTTATAPGTPGTPTLTYVPANNTSTNWGYSATWSNSSTGTTPISYYLKAYGSSDDYVNVQTTLGPFSTGASAQSFLLPRTSTLWQVAVYASNSAGTSSDSLKSNSA
jgi:uncharacterized repeat protein (TIGR02543 family)